MKLAILVLIALLFACCLHAQTGTAHTDAECSAKIPTTDVPDIDQGRENEAIYYACRLGVSEHEVKGWQAKLGDYGMLEDVIPRKIAAGKFLILHTLDGSAHCNDFTVLKKTENEWRLVWELPNPIPEHMKHCSFKCPMLKANLSDSGILSVGQARPANPKESAYESCKNPVWKWIRFRWDGKTFVLVKNNLPQMNAERRR